VFDASLPIPATGRVTLVGAGPGAADLLTLRALRAIEEADIVYYDNLVGGGVLALIPSTARRVFVGKRKGFVSVSKKDVHDRMVRFAMDGQRVVRLKGGDPFIFGRGGEEADELRVAGVAVDVVPGITAALGAAADHTVPLTHRDLATSVTFVTAHRAQGAPNLRGLFAPDRTLAVYMGISSAGAVSEQLEADGTPPSWPVLVVEKATLPEQRAIHTTLGALEQDLAAQEVVSPALLIIGPVTDATARSITIPDNLLSSAQAAAQ